MGTQVFVSKCKKRVEGAAPVTTRGMVALASSTAPSAVSLTVFSIPSTVSRVSIRMATSVSQPSSKSEGFRCFKTYFGIDEGFCGIISITT